MRSHVLFLTLFTLCISYAKAQFLVSTELLDTYTAAELNQIPGLVPEHDVEVYKVVYNTVDAVGDPIIASGAFSRPLAENCFGFPVMIYFHGTTLNKENVPSRENSESQIVNLASGLGYYGLAPDYVGMGDSPGLHPYQHAQSEATSGVDMLRAVREFLTELNEYDNGEIMITGYSQGGHAAMAMHKYVEENDLLTEIDIIGSAPLSGAYDMSGSQVNVLLSDQPYTNPGYVVYVLSSYELAYGNIYDTYSDVLQSPHDATVVPYFDGNNTTYSMNDLNPQLPQILSDLMDTDYLTAFENDMGHPLRVALADNDVYDWAPERPVRMYYCSLDEQVDYTNSTTALATMQSNGAADVAATNLGPLNHGGCSFPALLGAVNYFNSIRTVCQPSGLDELYTIDIALYPNPAVDWLNVNSPVHIRSWRIIDARGREVMRSAVKKFSSSASSSQLSIDLRDLSAGTYQLEVRDADGNAGLRSFVK